MVAPQRPLQVRVAVPGAPARLLPLDQPPYRVGRTPDNAIVLPHPVVSSRHGEFVALEGGLAFVDLGSRNGTRLNGKLLERGVPVLLAPGDQLQIGPVTLSLEAVTTSQLVLEVQVPGAPPRQVEVLMLPFRLGRLPENDLVLDDPRVSGHHGELRAGAEGVVYVDLGSRNGTRLNGRTLPPQTETPLADGDSLVLGASEVVVRLPSAPAAAPPLAPTVPGGLPQLRAAPSRPALRGAVVGAVAAVVLLCLCAGVLGVAAVVFVNLEPFGPQGGPASGRTRIGRDGMVEVPIPAGKFLMGADDGDPDEAPQRVVELPAFFIDRNKVTVEMFSRWAARSRVEGDWSRDADPRSPVVGVTYADAVNYCQAQGRRLPTEAEWEKAARGEDGRIYPWGNNWDPSRVDFGSFKFSAYPIATYNRVWGPVGANREGASVYGVLDVAGGPREWVADWYGPYPGAKPLGFEVPQEAFRVTRGGFRANNYSRDVRTTARGWQLPQVGSADLGFRCAE
ncbi:MAG: hypothetical protein KatS3mg061_1057 [Dehalococcoidia bacterium]|nr:MAG: hypothetical protein KatS3mg061_1057 [Dehalococcoidia bacterium]